jgi:flagellar hook-basal body protein
MSTTSIAITGMRAAQAIISQTSNNIANSETPGFKSGLIDLANIAGDNGVSMLEGNAIDLKGSLNYTGVATDLAVSNNRSFFIVKNKINTEVVNVVTGSFRPNKEGQLEYLGKYLLLGAQYGDDDSLPPIGADTLQPIVINTNMMSAAVPTTKVVETFNLNCGLLAKGQASFVMNPNGKNTTPGAKLDDPLQPSDELKSGSGFLMQIKSEVNGEIKTENTKCIFTSAITSNTYGSTGTDLSNGSETDDISIIYNGNKTVSIARSSVKGATNSATLENIANRINSIIGNDQAYVVTNNDNSQLIIKPPLNGSDSLFISGALATSLNITTQILPAQRGSVRFTSMLDLKNALTGSFNEINSSPKSQSLLFVARPNTNVSFANLDDSSDVLGALGMYEGPVIGQGYDPYNEGGNMASGTIRPDIVEAVSFYDSKGGQHIANVALKKVEDGWIQEVYMSNPQQIYGVRDDGLVQVTKFTFDSKGKLTAAGPVVPNAITSAMADPYSQIPAPGGAQGQFSLDGVTFNLGTDFNTMADLVNKINGDPTLNINFQATIVKDPTGGYSIAVIAKGSTRPVIETNLFNVTNEEPLPDGSKDLKIIFNPVEKLEPLTISFDYTNMAESVHKEMFGTLTSNGMGPSTLANISIDNSGDIIGTFANGASKKLYKIPLATYANVNGLDVIGDNALRASATSGKMQVNIAGDTSVGEILSGNIETSNIEQAEELTKLITNKQFYNMNTKSWQTGNAILDYLLNATN